MFRRMGASSQRRVVTRSEETRSDPPAQQVLRLKSERRITHWRVALPALSWREKPFRLVGVLVKLEKCSTLPRNGLQTAENVRKKKSCED